MFIDLSFFLLPSTYHLQSICNTPMLAKVECLCCFCCDVSSSLSFNTEHLICTGGIVQLDRPMILALVLTLCIHWSDDLILYVTRVQAFLWVGLGASRDPKKGARYGTYRVDSLRLIVEWRHSSCYSVSCVTMMCLLMVPTVKWTSTLSWCVSSKSRISHRWWLHTIHIFNSAHATLISWLMMSTQSWWVIEITIPQYYQIVSSLPN